jgi:hypothetical protein
VSVHGRTEGRIFSRHGDDARFDFNMATIKNLFGFCPGITGYRAFWHG